MGLGSLRRRFAAKLREVELVTFDVFDTALVRGVARPEDVFLHIGIEAKASGILPHGLLEIADFVEARKQAEKEARGHAWVTNGWVEVRLEEIHARLAIHLALDESRMQALMALEQRIEQAHGLRNPFVGSLFEQARRAGKKIGFISDMYLDEALVAGLLEQAGYGGYDFLLVSSTSRETKASGSLFKKVIDTHKIASRKWLHVGDNLDSDVKRARSLGIQAIHYEKCGTHFKTHPVMGRRASQPSLQQGTLEAGLFRSIVNGLIAARYFTSPDAKTRNVDSNPDFWKDWGYQHVGPLLAGFGSWLVHEVSRHSFRDVYFLSRDGYLIKEVVDHMLRPETGAKHAVRTHYLYASRRAFNLAAIENLDEEALDFLVSGTSRMSPRQFLARIDIDIECHLDAVTKIGFSSLDEVVDGAVGYGRLRALLRELGDIVLERARSELGILTQYFAGEGLLDGGHVAIVDLGWHGTLQNAMDKLIRRMGATTVLAGYYMGTFPPAKRYADRGQVMHGYLCEAGYPETLHAAIKTSVELFEWVFSAPHGSVCNFRSGVTGVEPVFADFAFESERWSAASAMQAGAMHFIDDYLAIWQGQTLPVVPPEEAVKNFHAALARPTSEEAMRLGSLQHAEGFGRVAVPRFIGKPQGSIWNPFSYPELILGYRNAFWPQGYLRNLFGKMLP